MKKIFYFLLAVLPLALSGCLKGNSIDNDELRAVQPGVAIYNGAMNQHTVAQQQAEIALRLAILLAEADAQGKTIEEVGVGDNNSNLKHLLLGAATVTSTETGYDITFVNYSTSDIDSYRREGVISLHTNGAALLREATVTEPWEVTFNGDFKLTTTGSYPTTYEFEGGSTTLYYNETDREYMVSMTDQAAYAASYPTMISDWSGEFSIEPVNTNLTYTDCAGKVFFVSGSASGTTFNLYGTGGASEMGFSISGEYVGTTQVRNCTIEADLRSNYAITAYPAPNVRMVWAAGADNRYSMTIYYDGHVYVQR